MMRSEFVEAVERAQQAQPLWFDLEPDALLEPHQLASLEESLRVTLPEDFVWFLSRYGGGYFAFAEIYSGDVQSPVYLCGKQHRALAGSGLAFSDNGCGDLYFFPVVDGVAIDRVEVLDHETGSRQVANAAGFLAYLAEVALHS